MDDIVTSLKNADLTNAKVTHSSCYMCTSDCPIIVTSQGDEILDISHPDCVRATAMLEQRESEDRLIHAMTRENAAEAWMEVSWEDAVRRAALKMQDIKNFLQCRN